LKSEESIIASANLVVIEKERIKTMQLKYVNTGNSVNNNTIKIIRHISYFFIHFLGVLLFLSVVSRGLKVSNLSLQDDITL